VALASEARAQRETRAKLAGEAGRPGPEKLVLFGDLHVHTSYSWDGFLGALPIVGGEGAHPPSDACDFARHCSGLDFFALTDHAESMLPDRWRASKESVRACNARAGDGRDPDLVAFMGFEWSQAGLTPETHFGHRCVVFRDDAEERLPSRPISAVDRAERYQRMRRLFGRLRWLSPWSFGSTTAYLDFLDRLTARASCPEGVDVRALPPDCQEVAPTPRELHAKLDAWGFDALTIPHGTTWGSYTPAGATIDKHLDPLEYDGARMRLVEIMSGHGNSEEFRRFREVLLDAEGPPACPAPTREYLPCCWQAGEIMRERCGDLPAGECERRVALARSLGARAFTRPQQIFPDAAPEEWLDCGQCRDCFKPSYGYRPRESVQYAMALTREREGAAPLRLRYGFVASSDNHSARPGTGYKQVNPTQQSDVRGTLPFPLGALQGLGRRLRGEPETEPRAPEAADVGLLDADQRALSFLYPGGLAAVHAEGRSREAIWAALLRREVYGTSGPRILLWFELENGAAGRAPMGSEHALAEAPRFEVRAAGSFEQEAGCPEASGAALGEARVARLCGGECHHPGARRRAIAAIEVVRIRPQRAVDEPVEALIQDPWRRFECAPEPTGCAVRFDDPDFVASARPALYYARALEEPSLALNGRPLATRFGAEGEALSVEPCLGARIDAGGCPTPVQERAWSSPIFVEPAR
jgi:hypothetical protein